MSDQPTIPAAPHPDPADHDAARTVRRHTRGVAMADGVPHHCRFLYDGRTGELVLGAEQPILDAAELTIGLPDDTFDADATLLVRHRPAGEDAWTDRHMAYHPEARATRFARAVIDSVKLRSGRVIDADRLALTNPLLDVEPALCKRLNADRDALRELCRLMAGVEPDEPVAVGVDRYGIDVRARFGIVRVELPAPCQDPGEGLRVVEALLGGLR
jgi:hypothetical protein